MRMVKVWEPAAQPSLYRAAGRFQMPALRMATTQPPWVPSRLRTRRRFIRTTRAAPTAGHTTGTGPCQHAT